MLGLPARARALASLSPGATLAERVDSVKRLGHRPRPRSYARIACAAALGDPTSLAQRRWGVFEGELEELLDLSGQGLGHGVGPFCALDVAAGGWLPRVPRRARSRLALRTPIQVDYDRAVGRSHILPSWTISTMPLGGFPSAARTSPASC